MRAEANSVALLAALAVVLGACGAPGPVPSAIAPLAQPTARPGGEILLTAADLPDLRQQLAESSADELTATALSAELDVVEGRFTRAFDRYVEVLEAAPDTLLGAMAAARLDAMALIVRGFEERAEPIVARFAHGGELHPLTALFVNSLAIKAAWAEFETIARPALAAGDGVGPFSAEELGLPDAWRVAGPFSPYPLQDLTRPEPFDGDVILADVYRPDGRRVETELMLGNGRAIASGQDGSGNLGPTGTYVLETWAELASARDVLVALEAAAGARVTVDGEVVATRLETGGYEPWLRVALVRLEPGWHRVRVRVGWDGESELRLRLIPLGQAPTGLRFESRPPSEVGLGTARPLWLGDDFLEAVLPAGLLADGPDPNAAAGPVETYALARLATELSRPDVADRALAELLGAGVRPSPLVSTAVARLASERRDTAPSERFNQRMSAVRETLDVAPSAHGMALSLISVLAGDGREDEALRLATSLGDWLQGEPVYWITMYDLYDRRGWDELAEEALEQTLGLEPRSCSALARLLDLYHFRDHYPEPGTWPDAFDTCEEGVLYQVDSVLLPRGRTDEAIALLDGLTDRAPDDTRLQRRRFDLLMGLGRHDEALALLPEAVAHGLDESEAALLRADGLLVDGHDDEALEVIEAALRDEEPGDYTLLRARAVLRGERLLDDLRVDTRDAIERYRASSEPPRSGAVYALDYGAYRYFPDGSHLLLTHQILHLASREALGTYGEVSVPGRAILLRARTIKADGTILEPDNIPGKETISMPNLEVGDFVEYEYLEVAGPNPARPASIVGPRFFFQVFDAPLAHSEMIIEVPSAWDELVFDRRAGAPEPEVTTSGETRRYRFVVRDSGLPVEEDGAPAVVELLPSVRFAHDATWADTRSEYAERLLAVVRVTPELREVAEALVAEAQDERDAVRSIFRAVVDAIEETGGFLSTDASWTWKQGEGERLPLLLALLEAAGFEADLVFLKSLGDDAVRSPIPDPDEYRNTFVRVEVDRDAARGGRDAIWLSPSRDHAAFDYIRPDVQGTTGVVLESRAPGDPSRSDVAWITSPTWPPETNLQEVSLTLALDASGDYTAEVVERVPRRNAAGTRLYLEQIQDERQLVQDLEAGLTSSFPNVEVDAIEVDGADDPDAPLVLRYGFRGRGLARVDGGRLVIDRRILDRRLRSTLGAQAERVHPLVLDYPFAERVRMTIGLPDGYRFTELPEPVRVDPPWLTYELTLEGGDEGDGRVTLVRETSLAVGRVAPEQYPELLDALRRIDEAESLRLVGER